jgi:arylsulfatase A-like enzyme
MRILYLDCDTLRPDHLHCYGYHRETSPNIDLIASEGVRFTNYYASDAPCLPSRSALMNGRFGIHTGIVNHGGTAADLRLEGASRGFCNAQDRAPLTQRLQMAGFHTVSVSPYAERHSAWWFHNGFAEFFNPGKRGMERAEEVAPWALDWLERKGKTDNWFLHVNFWDPHTPYRSPSTFGNPFESVPPPAWHTETVRKENWAKIGAHSARCPRGYPWDIEPQRAVYPDIPDEIASQDDYKRWIDGYDTGIRYMDQHIGQILECLERLDVLKDTVIIVSADHGENQGELNIYGDHMTCDYITARVPLIIRWPGVTKPNTACESLLYNLDLAPTLMELVGGEPSPAWDGASFAGAVRGESFAGREHLVLSQCAWSCQRAVRWNDWLLLRTYRDALNLMPGILLFNVEEDPHEQHDLGEKRQDLVNEGLARLDAWHTDMMRDADSAEDPLWRVMREGGPFHIRGCLERFCAHLRETDQAPLADALEIRHRGPGTWSGRNA